MDFEGAQGKHCHQQAFNNHCFELLICSICRLLDLPLRVIDCVLSCCHLLKREDHQLFHLWFVLEFLISPLFNSTINHHLVL